jgi:hypothetical protein
MQSTAQTVLCVALKPGMKAMGGAARSAAEESVSEALALLRDTARSCGASIVKATADRLIMVFRNPDAAAGGAARLHAALDSLLPLGDVRLAARIAFHCAATRGSLDDPAVRLVLRMLARARDGETLTSRTTAVLLGTSFRAFSRRLQASPLPRPGARGIYEVRSARK